MEECANCGQKKVRPENYTVAAVARLRGKEAKKNGKLCHDCATKKTEELIKVMG